MDALPEKRNQGSKILRHEGQTRNSNTPLPPAKGKIKSKPGIHAKGGEERTVRELSDRGKLSGQPSDGKRSAPRRIKLANTAKKRKALMITGPAIWSIIAQ